MKNKKRIIIISIFAMLFLIFAVLFTVFLVVPYFRFIDNNTWATVTIEGEITPGANGVFELTQEYLKGDAITVGDVTLKITDIGTEGTVRLKVQSGNLYDTNGNAVKKFKIDLNNGAEYIMDNGSVNFTVISNRYQ